MVKWLVQKDSPFDGIYPEPLPDGIDGPVHDGKLLISNFIEKVYLSTRVILSCLAGMHPQMADTPAQSSRNSPLVVGRYQHKAGVLLFRLRDGLPGLDAAVLCRDGLCQYDAVTQGDVPAHCGRHIP